MFISGKKKFTAVESTPSVNHIFFTYFKQKNQRKSKKIRPTRVPLKSKKIRENQKNPSNLCAIKIKKKIRENQKKSVQSVCHSLKMKSQF